MQGFIYDEYAVIQIVDSDSLHTVNCKVLELNRELQDIADCIMALETDVPYWNDRFENISNELANYRKALQILSNRF